MNQRYIVYIMCICDHRNINDFMCLIIQKKETLIKNMAIHNISTSTVFSFVVLLPFLPLILQGSYDGSPVIIARAAPVSNLSLPDAVRVQFALNLEYLEAEFFLFGALGYGLDKIDPELADGGPPPIGAKLANLGPLFRDVIFQFGLQEIGHLRAIKSTVGGFPRPFMDLRKETFAKLMDSAFGRPLLPPFDPYANEINYMLASYVIPYVGLTGYVGTNPQLQNTTSKRLVAGLLGIESGQDGVIRTLLYERRELEVVPYGVTVAEFTDRISTLRNKLGKEGVKDEGLVVPKEEGAEGRVSGNVLAGDKYSLSYARTPEEVLRIVYATGDEREPGGFYPKGAKGLIARSYLTPHS